MKRNVKNYVRRLIVKKVNWSNRAKKRNLRAETGVKTNFSTTILIKFPTFTLSYMKKQCDTAGWLLAVIYF